MNFNFWIIMLVISTLLHRSQVVIHYLSSHYPLSKLFWKESIWAIRPHTVESLFLKYSLPLKLIFHFYSYFICTCTKNKSNKLHFIKNVLKFPEFWIFRFFQFFESSLWIIPSFWFHYVKKHNCIGNLDLNFFPWKSVFRFEIFHENLLSRFKRFENYTGFTSLSYFLI